MHIPVDSRMVLQPNDAMSHTASTDFIIAVTYIAVALRRPFTAARRAWKEACDA
jgi:hypothetical protein